MIKPVTCVCLLLAAGSGLYLYQVKHQAQLLDQEIAHTLAEADAVRQRAGVLQAEYALQNDPSRLAELAGRNLPQLHTTEPAQFASFADLDKRLPAVGPSPAEQVHDPVPEAQPALVAAAEPARPATPKPEAPKPDMSGAGPRVALAAAAPLAVPRTAPPPRPAPHVAEPARIDPVRMPRPVPAAVPAVADVAYTAPVLAARPFVGSSLGMARTLARVAPSFAPSPAAGSEGGGNR